MKSKKKKSKDKGKKKHKKEKYRKSSSSSSSSEDEQEWVEKTPQASVQEEPEKQEEPLKRDDWMSLNNLFPCVSNMTNAERKKSRNPEGDVNRSILDEPGQSSRELNPYWKNGGTGLPQEELKKSSSEQTMDVRWLKKSLRRAEEQAASEGRSLEEIAAERWGSLETIQEMIAKAERTSSSNKWSSRDARYDRNKDDGRNNRDGDRKYKFDNRSRNEERYRDDRYQSRRSSRSRSRSRERNNRYQRNIEPPEERRRKPTYKRPTDDDYYDYSAQKTQQSRTKNWKKEKEPVKYEEQQPKLRTVEPEPISQPLETSMETDAESKEDKPITEAEMNKLGAKIVKAEIMGDTELAAELKSQLERARKLHVKSPAVARGKEEVENVILTRTDARGVTRPLEPRTDAREPSGSSRKKKSMQTHESGQRVRHYFDDDKYSLEQLFQREKGRSTNDDDAAFTKVLSKNMDMNDIFEEQITRVHSDAKQDDRDRMQAIREHKRMSKSLDNCRWCLDSKYMLKHMIVAMDSEICLSLPHFASLTEGHCILTPVQHAACQLQLDEDVWSKLKVFKQVLCKMFKDQDECPVFFEIYKSRHKFPHMQLECVPLPREVGDSAPMYFKKALLECETEWSINKKIVDLKHKDIRHAVPNGLSYFMVQFGMEDGYAHVIEDEHMFPKNFAEEIIGGMLDLDHDFWRKPRKENFDEQREKVLKFSAVWKKYDFTKHESD